MAKFNDNQIPTAEERLMALLALNSQSLPNSAVDSPTSQSGVDIDRLIKSSSASDKQKLYAYLDSDPDAFSQFIDRYRPKQVATNKVATPLGQLFGYLPNLVDSISQSFANSQFGGNPNGWRKLGYQFAGLALIVVVTIVIVPFGKEESRFELLESAYSDLAAVEESKDFGLVMPWEQPSNGLGFAPDQSIADSSSKAFTVGLMEARAAVLNSSSAAVDVRFATSAVSLNPTANTELMVQLGVWNVLLWQASYLVEELPTTFWKNQLQFVEAIQPEFSNANEVALVSRHLDQVLLLLNQLSLGQSPLRNASELRTETTLLREQLALRDISLLNAN